MYQEYLTFRGYRVVTAASGAEALEVAHRPERPALILMDLQLHDMDGTAALRALRSDPAFADVPIIAFTAHVLQEEQDQAIRDGFDGVISKPCLPPPDYGDTPFLDRQRDSGL